jgi:CubicO group peptidase (beta-lactamase class C family)
VLNFVREQVAAGMEELALPGVALGVVAADREETACFGVTSVENPLEVTPDTLFQIGSIGKTYLAAAVLRLVENGRLDLDAPVRRYLPEFRLADEDAAARVTTRHLLTHTGGWVGDLFEDFGRGDDALARAVVRLAELPQLTPLGAVWAYNNAGFYVAGRVIEAVTGSPYEAALRELVLDPLGLEHSFFFPDEVMTYRFATGHVRGEDEPAAVSREWWIGRAAHSAGGIVQSLRDLLRYARFAFDGQPLLAAESFAELRRPQVPIGGEVDAVGLAWMLRTLDGVELIFHDGGTSGQVARLVVAPERRFAFAALSNHNYGGVLIERVARAVLERHLGIREPELEPVELEPGRLAEYAGRYRAWISDIDLTVAGDALELQLTQTRAFPKPDSPIPPPPPPARFVFYDEDRVFAPDGVWKGTRVEFLRDGDGRIAWLRAGGRIYAPERSA